MKKTITDRAIEALTKEKEIHERTLNIRGIDEFYKRNVQGRFNATVKAIQLLTYLKQEEEELIKEAYSDGDLNGMNLSEPLYKHVTAQEYFNQTFNR